MSFQRLKTYYPKDAGMTLDDIANMINERIENDEDFVSVEELITRLDYLQDGVIQTFVDSWYDLTLLTIDLCDTAPIMQEQLLQNLAMKVNVNIEVVL